MEQVRAVVIGFGGMGRQYAQLVRDGEIAGMRLTGICCRNEKGQAVIREEYPGVAVYTDVDDTFAHEKEFDAVIVVTPHATHVEIGKRAFAAGKHVLCDKPAGVSVKEVEGLLAEARRAGTSFAMMFNCRVAPSFAKAKEIVAAGGLGTVTRAVWVCNNWFRTTCYHKSAPWRSSWAGEHGGLLINQCQHYLDLWQWILGMPDQLDASIDFGKYNDFDVDDSVDIRFLYDSGLRGSFISASGENPGVNRFEIWGTKGMISIEGNEKLTLPVPEGEHGNLWDACVHHGGDVSPPGGQCLPADASEFCRPPVKRRTVNCAGGGRSQERGACQCLLSVRLDGRKSGSAHRQKRV